MTSPILLRPARTTDAGAIGDILGGFQSGTGWMPKLHTGAEFIAFGGRMIDRGWVTVAMAMSEGRVIGFIARDHDEIAALYVSGTARSKGAGGLLLSHAKARSEALRAQVFVANTGARRFYHRAGFAEVGQGDGAGNDENLPAVTCVWKREGHAMTQGEK